MDESPSRLPMPSQIPKKDGAKRRSMLLPPGTISGGLKKGVLSPTEEDPPKRRPMTMFGAPSALQSTKEEEVVATGGGDEDSRLPSPESKEAARASAHAALMGGTKPPAAMTAAPKSGIARSSSIRAPGTSRIGTSRPIEQPRATRSSARPVSMIKESTSRPVSVASTASKSSAEAPPTTSTSRLRAPAANSTGLRRSNTTTTAAARHSRTQSAAAPTSNAAQPRNDVRRHPTISEGSSEVKSQLHRPAFSTLQQHYSPKKNLAPKPASSTLIHSAQVDTSSSLSLETQFLQTRLLQLSLLHKQAEPTYQAWTKSARRALKHKFTDVAAEYEVVQQKEKEVRRRKNAAALKEWCHGDFALLGENINTLSNIVNEVMALLDENGGRVYAALEIFEAWITWVEAIYSNRDNHAHRNSEFIDGLGESWKAEVASLIRKLQALSRQIDGLGRMNHCGEGSSLVAVIRNMNGLTKGAVEELRLVEGLEAEVVRKEGRWVDEQVGGMMSDINALLA